MVPNRLILIRSPLSKSQLFIFDTLTSLVAGIIATRLSLQISDIGVGQETGGTKPQGTPAPASARDLSQICP